ncbi:MAG: AraC family transcriptional regulator [Ignavibacteria bacterium]|jgi:YesN/AraC family two-component response regulator
MKTAIITNLSKLLYLSLTIVSLNLVHANDKDSIITEINSLQGADKVIKIHKLTRTYFYEDPLKARDLSLQALQLSQELDNDSLIAYSYNYLGLAYYFLDYWKLSVDAYEKSMATRHAKNSPHFNAALANNIAIDYEFLGEYEKSAEYYYKALAIKEPEKDSSFIAKTFMNLGLLDIKTEKPGEAAKKFKFALPIFQKGNDLRNITSSYQNLFIAEFELQNLKQAEFYFTKALEYAEKLNDSVKTTDVYLDYGNGLFSNKVYFKSLNNYKLALQYSDSLRAPSTYFRIIKGIGQSLLFLGDLEEAQIYLIRADSGLFKYGPENTYGKNKLSLARLYARKGNWEKFNENLESYIDLKGKILKKEEVRAIEELNIIYETGKKKQQIKLQQAEISNKNNRIILISSVAGLVSIGLLLTLLLTRKLKFANDNLIRKNMELSQRWQQLHKYYKSVESGSINKADNELFLRVYSLMTEKEMYKNTSITAVSLAKELNTNTKYLSNAIKEETGMNFNTFVNTFRIEEAKRILRDEVSANWSLDAVAEKSGFNNTTSFFQAFKRTTGLTPSSFKKATK